MYFRFCGGYVDAEDGSGSEPLAPRFYSPANITVTDDFKVKGLTPEQGVALFSATSVGSQYYIDLLAAGSDSTYSEEELALVTDEDLKPIVEMYAADEAALLEAFASGWTYLMTADRYKVSARLTVCFTVKLQQPTVANSRFFPPSMTTEQSRKCVHWCKHGLQGGRDPGPCGCAYPGYPRRTFRSFGSWSLDGFCCHCGVASLLLLVSQCLSL